MKQILAVDSGATKTCAGLYTDQKTVIAEDRTGPSNPFEAGASCSISRIVNLGNSLLKGRGRADIVAVGMSGAKDSIVRREMGAGILKGLNASKVMVTDDRWPLLVANAGSREGIIVISGTGASILGKTDEGEAVEVGGRGGLLGDEGSAFRTGLEGLRACVRGFDGLGPYTSLFDRMLEATNCRDIWELVFWSHKADKTEIARLAGIVTSEATKNDEAARSLVEQESFALARQVITAYQRLSLHPDAPVYFNGGLIEGDPIFRELFINQVNEEAPGLKIIQAPLKGSMAVLEMVLKIENNELKNQSFVSVLVSDYENPHSEAVNFSEDGVPPTEMKLGVDQDIDSLSAAEIVKLMNGEDSKIPGAVADQGAQIAKAIKKAAKAISNGGRIIYVGAGTSGRLGVLDASECPPTFGVSPDRVIGIMAGGDNALRNSIEGEEDNKKQGAADLKIIDPPLCKNDFLVGITASGSTPYVLAAIDFARKRGADVALLCCNPGLPDTAPLVIAIDTGPESLAGSTRLKAGTATKLVLNMISTGAMALSGRIYKGLMVGVAPSNTKLRKRSVNIIRRITGVSDVEGIELLVKSKGDIAAAVLMAKSEISQIEAVELLRRKGGSLKRAIEEQ